MRAPRLALRSFLALALAVGGIALSGCSGGGGTGLNECEDGIDNDGDLLIDEADPACIAGGTRESDDPVRRCTDGLDNDGDGLIDFPADPGCESAEDDDEFNPGPPACADSIDNDGDGLIDFPNDPGCLNANQENEADDCPDGPNCPQCGDGVDNDGDERTDYPNDTGCASASDDDEFILDTSACGVGTPVEFLPPGNSVTVTGTIGNGVSGLSSLTCGGRGKETVYVVQVDRALTMVASTDNAATTFNTVLYVRSSCRNDQAELGCSDDISATNTRSKLTVDLVPGVYFLVVDGRDLASSGAFSLKVDFYMGAGETCVDANECAPGYVCRAVPPSTTTTCERPVCSDGRDDDNDGLIDFPNDPGCTDADDADETDTCPGVGCPACGDGADNDADGFTDYPNDIGCASAADDNEIDCDTETDPLVLVTGPSYSGTTVGATNDHRPTCGSTTNTAPDVVHYVTFQVPVQTLTISTVNAGSWDSAISLIDATCTTSLACSDPNTLTVTAVAPGTYGIVMDGWGTSSGAYTMNIHGDLTAGADCADPLVAAGVLACPSGYACQGPAGSETCAPAACNDGMDNDGDGLSDFPNDPGCASPSDPDELDDCPSGPNCPACSNGADDDGDGLTDYPADFGCTGAGGTTELACAAETDPVLLITTSNTSGTTVGASNSLRPTCGASTHTAPERVHILNLRVPVRTLAVNLTSSFDAATSFTDATCGTTLFCSDPNSFTRTNVAAGAYAISVDGWSTASGTYTLNVAGTLAAGDSCEDPLVDAGVVTCPSLFACAGAAGSRTCVPAACNDGMDNDGDGLTDFPDDPGCGSASDGDEFDDCPSGPSCPVCSNGIDDDGDGDIDFPMDVGCAAPGGTTELGCAPETDPLIPITAPATSGTTVGASNSLRPTCGATTHTAPERVHMLTLRVPVASLAISLVSSFDAATSLTDVTCGTTIQCSDPNSFTRTNVSPGTYAISVDGWGTGSGTYTLNVAGSLNIGDSCEDPLVDAGVLNCPALYACGGTPGSRTCVPAACNDGMDNDGDGLMDYPNDPGCASASDGDELDDCPTGPNCPACSNGVDDDGDGDIDYPNDVGCSSAGGTTELGCGAETDPLIQITGPATSGTTVGASDSLRPTCGASTHAAPERVHLLTLQIPLATLAVNLVSSFDAATSLTDVTCGTTIQCSDPNSFTRTNVTPGTYAISVDGWGTASGTYTLNLAGTLNAGDSCEDPLVDAGLITCPNLFACGGTPGSRTCVPAACNDGMDNDGDGLMDFPADPGCTSASDGDELDDCPTGPNCPACSNGVDDDGDGQTDYPVDTNCTSAADTTELGCGPETDEVGIVTGPLTTGTTVGAANNFTPTCQTNTIGDRVFILTLAVPVATLHLDTENSILSDSVLMVTDAVCGLPPIACDDDSGNTPANSSLLDLTNIAAGSYGIVVDTWGSSTPNPFNLNISGTIAAGDSCADPLVAAGVLTCAAGTTCQVGVCSP